MEARWKLDAAGRSFLIALALCVGAAAQDAEALYQSGIDLADQQRLAEARELFAEAVRRFPQDARFPVELGGVAFRQGNMRQAAALGRRGLKLNPSDEYTNDFLGTVYFLSGNSDAALKYWSRVGKPLVAGVRLPEHLQTDPVLLDRAFAFAPGERLRPDAWSVSRERVNALGMFANPQLRLTAREDGRVDVELTGIERNGFGVGVVDALATTLRGIGYRTVRPEYSNIGGSANHIETLLRWDPNKRRLSVVYSGPLRGNPGRRYELGVDAREENWSLREGSLTELGALKLGKAAVFAGIRSVGDGTWRWSLGGEASDRRYRDLIPWTTSPSAVLLQGFQLKQTARMTRALRRAPEHRFESRLSVSSEAGRIWADRSQAFEKLQAGIGMKWLPQMRGDDYAVRGNVRGGQIFGSVPFDELTIVGLERDNDLPLRAHIGTQNGRKGSAPIGRRYLLANFEIDKTVYSNGWFTVALSPFFDAGRIDNSWGLGQRRWLLDTGIQAKLRLLGVSFTFVYGKDLRTGANAFYTLNGATVVLPGRD